jgi:hypothetical protein
MWHQVYDRIDGQGRVVTITITGKPSRTCVACSMVINGSAVGCYMHEVRRVEEIRKDLTSSKGV